MMMWYGMSGWGYGLMGIGMVLFWALLIVGLVALARYIGSPAQQSTTAPPQHGPTAQQVLADRFARGEIDDEEYIRRLQTLAGAPASPAPRDSSTTMRK